MRIFVLAGPETHLAFALAGINGQVVHSEAEVGPILENLNREEIGLVLITDALADQNREVIDRILLEPGGPLILEIPDFKAPESEKHKATERIISLLRR